MRFFLSCLLTLFVLTCPLCRNSSAQTPASNPPASPTAKETPPPAAPTVALTEEEAKEIDRIVREFEAVQSAKALLQEREDKLKAQYALMELRAAKRAGCEGRIDPEKKTLTCPPPAPKEKK